MNDSPPNKKEIFADFVGQILTQKYSNKLDRITIAALNLGIVKYKKNSYDLIKCERFSSK